MTTMEQIDYTQDALDRAFQRMNMAQRELSERAAWRNNRFKRMADLEIAIGPLQAADIVRREWLARRSPGTEPSGCQRPAHHAS